MSVQQTFEHFFKPEVRKTGEALVAKNSVFLQRGSDTQVEAFVRTSTPAKVAFSSESIESSEFLVDCNCSASKKGQLCKHIWAVLVLAEEKAPDFFSSKESLEKGSRVVAGTAASESVASSSATTRTPERPVSDSQKAYLEAQKQRQSDYRKQAYQAQKERAKGFKKTREEASAKANRYAVASENLPSNVQAALKFFEENGFPMTAPADPEAVNNAKRILSRVFHPDKGGTNEEILALLAHAKSLSDYD